MRLDQVADDSETKTGPTLFARTCGVRAIESLEDSVEVRARDTDTGVDNFQHRPVILAGGQKRRRGSLPRGLFNRRPAPERDGAATRRVTEGITEEVRKDLPDGG